LPTIHFRPLFPPDIGLVIEIEKPCFNPYKKLGLQIIGEIPGYYSETGEDALVMRKKLQA